MANQTVNSSSSAVIWIIWRTRCSQTTWASKILARKLILLRLDSMVFGSISICLVRDIFQLRRYHSSADSSWARLKYKIASKFNWIPKLMQTSLMIKNWKDQSTKWSCNSDQRTHKFHGSQKLKMTLLIVLYIKPSPQVSTVTSITRELFQPFGTQLIEMIFS